MPPRETVAVPVSERPHVLPLLVATAAFAAVALLIASPRTALYWYIFPLFGIGACYLFQFRQQLGTRWLITFFGTTIVSIVALALDWPFSGHVLWNSLFIGHAAMTGKRRGAWMAVLWMSLLYLFVMKFVSQTRRDVAGAFISIAVALVALGVLAVLDRRPTSG